MQEAVCEFWKAVELILVSLWAQKLCRKSAMVFFFLTVDLCFVGMCFHQKPYENLKCVHNRHINNALQHWTRIVETL